MLRLLLSILQACRVSRKEDVLHHLRMPEKSFGTLKDGWEV